MNRHRVIIAAIALVILAVGLLTLQLHDEEKGEALSQIQDYQLLRAQHLAKQLESFFRNYSQVLQVLSSFESFQQDGTKGTAAYILAHFKQQGEGIIRSASFHDEIGTIIYSTEGKMIGLNEGRSDFFSWAKKVGNKGKVFVSPPFFESGSPRIHLSTPLYREGSGARHSNLNGNFSGVLSLTIDLKEFLANQLHLLNPQINLYQIWIMDKDGKLLFQSEHAEMVPRNINQKDENCNQCHRSFDYVEKILKEKEGTIDYELRNSSRKIAAFAPMDIENVSWTVVISFPYDKVGVYARKGLQEHWMLLGIVVFALVGGSMLIVRNERLKVRAQEEAKYWREKRALEDEMQQSEVLYEAIIETAHDAICVLSTEGNFIFLNKSGEEMSGYKLSELAGKNFASLIHPEDLPGAKDRFIRTLEGKSYHADFEVRFCSKDGRIHLLSLNLVPLSLLSQRCIEKGLKPLEYYGN